MHIIFFKRLKKYIRAGKLGHIKNTLQYFHVNTLYEHFLDKT